MSTEDSTALVIGAGPAGLAVARTLTDVGYTVTVLEKAAEAGSSWAGHYDRLHLHTARTMSSLPGRMMPRRFGRWVARDDFRAYLRDYASGLDVRFGVTAGAVTKTDSGWHVESSAGPFDATLVVVATGYNHTAAIPAWPGLDTYTGRVLHSSEYRNPAALEAKHVLVVGPGNSGAEIAADLAQAGIAVELAVRTQPNIVRRQVLGIPVQALTLVTSPLPAKLGDRVSNLMQALTVGSLRKQGITKAPSGVFTQMENDDVTPTIDVGIIDALRAGQVTVVGAVESFTKDAVVLADGSTTTADLVLVATGFERGLEPLVGDLGVIVPGGRPVINAEEQLPGLEGLFFLGYSNPITGNLRQIGIDAKRIAKRATR